MFIDADAAGSGWFVDRTPADDSEFRSHQGVLEARSQSEAAGRMDLLSAVAHELGHALGLEHADGVMGATLEPGLRVTPAPGLQASPVMGKARPDPILDAAVAGLAVQHARPHADVALAAPPVIDWTAINKAALLKLQGVALVTGSRPQWLSDFVSNGGEDESERNPNGKIRVSVPAQVKLGLLNAGAKLRKL